MDPQGEEGREDHVGAFAVTAGLGIETLVKRFESEYDDYRLIMAKALADRGPEVRAETIVIGDRDTMEQERIVIDDLSAYVGDYLK